MKDFITFTRMSWSYMKNRRRRFFTGFWPAWRRWKKLTDHDRELAKSTRT